jgi:hypothetical protein
MKSATMREFQNLDDERAFDRLVDNELSTAERRTLLEALDTKADGWRQCAIAFLEAQSWSDDFRRLVRQSDRPRNASETVAVESAPSVRTISTVSRPMRQAITWASIAASMLVAFSLGTLQRERGTPLADLPAESGPGQQIADTDSPPTSEVPKTADDRDALTLWVRDDAGTPRSIRVPLMDAGTLDRELGVEFRSGLPSHVRAQLHDGGYQVQSKRRYAPLWLENGQRMVLPVEDTKIVPVSQNVY